MAIRSSPPCACTFCTIAPPHILRCLQERGDPQQRAAATRTLAVTRDLREERLRASAMGAAPLSAALLGLGSGARSTHDAQRGKTLPGRLARKESAAATGDAAVDEAHDGAGLTRDFLAAAFRRRSIDGRGMPLVSTVHFDRDYDNAFWDGRQMVYGDGDGQVFQRFTIALDVIGHELAHGVTQHTSNLLYFEQSGALNEHFSDVIGSLVKQWHRNQSAGQADWLIGEGLLAPTIHGRALRSMSAPGTAYDDPLIGKDPQPAHMRDYYFGPEDQGGVHINSGIPNRVFWRVAKTLGGPAWKVAGRIWWRAFTRMLMARATFADAARATIEAAGSVADAAAARTVRDAWAEAGVPVPRRPSVAAGRRAATQADAARAKTPARSRDKAAKPKRRTTRPVMPPAATRRRPGAARPAR